MQGSFQEIEGAFGTVPNLLRTYTPFPPLLEVNWSKVKAIMMEGNLIRALKEAIALLFSKDNARNYCIVAHETSLQAVGVRPEEIRRIETNLESQNGPVPPHE